MRVPGCLDLAPESVGLRPRPAACSGAEPGLRRTRLRQATAAQHRALEKRLEMTGCFDSREGFARYLHAMEPLYAALEEKLEAAGAGRWLSDWPRRGKTRLLRADLLALGIDRSELGPARAAVAAALPAAWPASVVLAVLYVLEGATLGGAVLSRRMAGLGLKRDCGMNFLDPYGAERGAMWQRYLDALEAVELPAEQDVELGRWAAATFALFAAHAPAACLRIPAPEVAP